MKLRTALLALFSGTAIWIIFPYLVIKLNQFLGLLVLHYWPLQVLGWILIICGVTIVGHLTLLFNVFGQGTPVPIEPAKKIVLESLYKHTRNPMYLCHLIIFLGEFLVFGAFLQILYLFLAWFGLHLFVVLWEEPGLKRRFGKEYADYCRRVPRWF